MSHFQEQIHHAQYTRQCRMAEAQRYRLVREAQQADGTRQNPKVYKLVLDALSLFSLVFINLLFHGFMS